MIKLRLKRFGKKKEASFRIVACNSTSRRDGRPLQELGFYNPRTKETRLDTEALRTRLTQGAQPTDVVRTLLEKGGLLEKTERPSIAIGKAKLEKDKLAKAKTQDKDNDSSKAEGQWPRYSLPLLRYQRMALLYQDIILLEYQYLLPCHICNEIFD